MLPYSPTIFSAVRGFHIILQQQKSLPAKSRSSIFVPSLAVRLRSTGVSHFFMCHLQVLLSQIIRQEPLISENRRPALRQLVGRLLDKMAETQHHSFSLFKVRRENQVAIYIVVLACLARCLASNPEALLAHSEYSAFPFWLLQLLATSPTLTSNPNPNSTLSTTL